jgi:hypothetical protein
MDKIIPFILTLSGVFNFKGILLEDRFSVAQLGFFILSIGILGSYLLYKYNKWLGILAGWSAFIFFKTLLSRQAPPAYLLEYALCGSFMFLLYYIVRQLRFKEDILKWFLIPACLNIILIIIQKFDHNILFFLPVDRTSGFLGNTGWTACYLAITTPLFFKYFKKGLPFLFLAILLCNSIVALIAFVVSLSFLLISRVTFYRPTILWVIIFIILFIGLNIKYSPSLKAEVRYRCSMCVGTLDGIKHNPILGWGMGSFTPIMLKVPEEKSIYCGVPFNSEDTKYGQKFDNKMNHPHNEILFNWWNVGIMFPILFLGLCWSIIRALTDKKLIPFAMLLAGFICLNGSQLMLPTWFLLIITLGIYETKEE